MDILAGFVVGGTLRLFFPCDRRMRPMALQQPFFLVMFGLVLGGILIVYDTC
jgi:hypothetical protein